jgi:hypothetical protein
VQVKTASSDIPGVTALVEIRLDPALEFTHVLNSFRSAFTPPPFVFFPGVYIILDCSLL